jgi:hypothetical protein
MQAVNDSSVTFEQLYVSANQSTKVFLVETPVGSCVLKRWAGERVRVGGNRCQVGGENAAENCGRAEDRAVHWRTQQRHWQQQQ